MGLLHPAQLGGRAMAFLARVLSGEPLERGCILIINVPFSLSVGI